MQTSIAFTPGLAPASTGPFGRYLPPIEDGAVAAWLELHAPKGAWILDPFGASPRLAVEAAQSGYTVLVAANNPVARFLLELFANPPAHSILQAVLADLAAAYKGRERLEPHLRGLYLTDCASCSREIMAEAFLWERDASAPYGRIYHCPHCGDAGEHPATGRDAERAAQFSSGGLHRARAIERVAPPDDPDRQHAEEAISMYLPRAVYALFSLINKLDSIQVSTGEASARRRSLEALLLFACDLGSALWSYPVARERPRKLAIPNRFRENNIWLALEEAVNAWSSLQSTNHAPIPITVWPELPAQAGVCIFTGRLRELVAAIREEPASKPNIAAVVTALPRPNQAFWTLSALWASWLWGREAAAAFKSVLRRRRYDWAWHTTAMESALASLPILLKPRTPIFGLVGEAEIGFTTAALIAGNMAGLHLDGIAAREETGQAQFFWHVPEFALGYAAAEKQTLEQEALQEIQSAARKFLQQRGEPCSSLLLQAAGLRSLVQLGNFSASGASPADVFTLIQNIQQQALSSQYGFIRYGGGAQSPETGQWWLRSLPKTPGEQTPAPLADRIEIAFVQSMQSRPGATQRELDALLCNSFPGLFTPNRELIELCLVSYGEQEPPDSGRWRLNTSDAPRARRADLASMRTLLHQLGQRLGFITQGDHPLVWNLPGAQGGYVFFILASAVIGEVILSNPGSDLQKLIVIPGSRAGLISYKLENDLRLTEAARQGSWRFIKFRLLRRLAESGRLDRSNLDEQLNLDPLSSTDPQLPLL